MITTKIFGVPSATSQSYTYEMTEKLCRPFCPTMPIKPAVTKTWSVAGTEVVGGFTYATIQCVISVIYQPKGCYPSAQKTNTYVERFVVSFDGVGTVTVADTNAYTEPAYICQNNCNAAYGITNVGNVGIAFTAN